jgi:hypothetical protein
VTEEQDETRDLAALPVPLAGELQATGDPWEPYRIIDPGGGPVTAVAEFFRDLQAAGRSEATLRSYGNDLLRWFRFIWAVEVPWNRATRTEARDFCRFIEHGTSISDGTTPMAAIDWDAAATALHAGEIPCSAGEQRILMLSASLAGGIPVDLRDAAAGLDDRNVQRLVTAILHASGKRPKPDHIDDHL